MPGSRNRGTCCRDYRANNNRYYCPFGARKLGELMGLVRIFFDLLFCFSGPLFYDNLGHLGVNGGLLVADLMLVNGRYGAIHADTGLVDRHLRNGRLHLCTNIFDDSSHLCDHVGLLFRVNSSAHCFIVVAAQRFDIDGNNRYHLGLLWCGFLVLARYLQNATYTAVRLLDG